MVMTVELKYGNVVLRTFIVPDELATARKSKEMGIRLGKEINELRPKLKAHEELTLKTCNCFWKDKPKEEREVNTSHSSCCAVWDLDNREF